MFHDQLTVDAAPDELIAGGLTFAAALEAMAERGVSLPPQELANGQATAMSWLRAKVRRALEQMPPERRWDANRGDVVATEDFVSVMRSAVKLFGWGPRIFEALIQTEVLLLEFRRAGERVYLVGPGRAQRLLHTERRGLTTDDLRLPYPSLALAVPGDLQLDLAISEPGYSTGSVESIYVAEMPTREGHRFWKLMFVSTTQPREGVAEGSMATFADVRLVPGVLLDDALSEIVNLSAEWRPVFDWFVNVMLYATSAEARLEYVTLNKEARQLEERISSMRARGFPKDNSKLQDLRRRLRALDPEHRIVVDAKTPKLTPEEMGFTRDGTPLMVRIKVAGHWKHQVHGPGRSQRKLIFIEPYWKGPEDAPGIAPPHVIKDPGEAV